MHFKTYASNVACVFSISTAMVYSDKAASTTAKCRLKTLLIILHVRQSKDNKSIFCTVINYEISLLNFRPFKASNVSRRKKNLWQINISRRNYGEVLLHQASAVKIKNDSQIWQTQLRFLSV